MTSNEYTANTAVSFPKEIANAFLEKSTIAQWNDGVKAYAESQKFSFLLEQSIDTAIAFSHETIRKTANSVNPILAKNMFNDDYDGDDAMMWEVNAYISTNKKMTSTDGYDAQEDMNHPVNSIPD